MFSEIYSTEEKPIIKVLLIKRNPKCRKNSLLSMQLFHVFDLIDELRQLHIIMSCSTVNSSVSKGDRQLLSAGPLVSDQLIRLSMGL